MSGSNKFYIERTCTEIRYGSEGNLDHIDHNKFLSDYKTQDAYVLLGEPGAGKTKSFEHEANEPNCKYIKARELIAFDTQKEWISKTLFIDGLDEVRIGSTNGHIPLDAIRNKLIKLGKPKFRLSCREADWLGASDRHDMESVASEGHITILHLEEFNEDEIKIFTEHENPTLDIEKFIDWGHKHSLIPMLSNPQILKLIVKSISGNKWPENKKDAYQIACENMVVESNVTHQQSKKSKEYSIKQLIEAAGKLSAHQLIGGLEGYSIIQSAASKYNPYYGSIFGSEIGVLELSLKTNLFKQGAYCDLREPAHRSIAEYLTAYYLADLVENKGLPIRRLLSLLTTNDGGIVSSLRGMFAWFLTLCPSQRSLLLNRDPLGLVLYGDVTAFSKEQKNYLFISLFNEARKHPGFRSENWLRSPFGALATKDMGDVIRRYLETHSRKDEDQALVDCVLDAVEHGEIFIGLKETLLNIVEDHMWLSGIRRKALRALIRVTLNDNNESIIKVLNDIHNEIVEDRDDELLGTLLSHLYPVAIKNNVFDYLHRPKDSHLYGTYQMFWRHELLNHTIDEDIPGLLDELSNRKDFKELLHHNYSIYSFISELLIEGVIKYGNAISARRLYDWLGIGLDKHEFSILEAVKRGKRDITIQQWISDRPKLYKVLLAEGTSRYTNGTKSWKYFHDITARLYGAKEPDDIGTWYLEQAERINNDGVSNDYFCQAVHQVFYNVGDKDFTLDTINDWVDKNPEFDALFQKMLVVDGKEYERIIENAKNKLERKSNLTKKKSDYLNYIIKNKNDIENGKASPAIFHDLAFAYYGHLMDARGDTPHERLSNLLNNSSELTKHALSGLKKTIFREDLPSVADIIKTASLGKTYYISHAVLAGLEERSLSDNSDWENIPDYLYEKIIAFQLIENSGTTPSWFTHLLRTRPDLISKILIQYVSSSAQSGKDHITGLYQLVEDTDWSSIAKNCILKLLEKYPARTKNSQISDIQNMLRAALRYADKSDFIQIIDKKLSYSSMDIMQRGKWLAAALILAPEKYERDALKYMEHSALRVLTLTSFLDSRFDQWKPDYILPASILVMLIQKLGRQFKPYIYKNGGRVTSNMDGADTVHSFIQKLSRINSSMATKELEKLLQLHELEEWHTALKGELYEHRRRLRDASFIQPSIESVVSTLSNNKPANAADLMALTLDHLEILGTGIRNNNTNDYRQYWNTDKFNKPDNPKVEDACRDALLSDLKTQLEKLNINAEKEGYFVEDKRSDIKISYMDSYRIVIPIEIKRDNHLDVWKALWSQLIEQYTRDPEAQDHGIYVVFWFGTGKTPPPPTGRKPSTADEMKKTLLDMMTEEEKRLIGLCVIDCSINATRIDKS